MLYLIEILHQTTTSIMDFWYRLLLYLIEILHQTTTQAALQVLRSRVVSYRNSTSNHNIESGKAINILVVSYRNSTSNHNVYAAQLQLLALYLIEILHQTTTPASVLVRKQPLYLIEILHQTTTMTGVSTIPQCCILSKFYIKPQLIRATRKK